MLLLIALAAGSSLLVMVLWCYSYLTAHQNRVSSRIQQYVGKDPSNSLLSTAQSLSQVSPQSHGWRLQIRNMSKHFESLQWSRLLEDKLVQAGLPMRGAEFMVICLGVALLSAVLFIVFSGSILLCLLGGMIGSGIPLLILFRKIDKRKKDFNDQLGDAIVLIANALRTGYSFMQAIEVVSREMAAPISEEFARVLKEMNLGVATENSLTNMAKRVHSEDLDLVITVVLIQRQVGGNLAVVLDNIASTIRQRVKIKGQIKTLTAQGKISGFIVGLLPVVIGGIMYLLNPEYIKVLFVHPLGRMMLIGGVVSQLIGIIVIRKIINIDI